MFVGVARIVLQIPGARSLKERRKVVKGFKDRVRARFPVSVAEVGDVEKYQVATLGVSVVSRDSGLCHDVLGQVRSVASNLPDALLADASVEVMSFGRGGREMHSGIEDVLQDAAEDSDDRTATDWQPLPGTADWEEDTTVDDVPPRKGGK